MIIYAEDYLEHHGVKGQKWGVRKKEDSSKQDKRDAKAQKFVDKANVAKAELDKINAAPATSFLKKRKERERVAELNAEITRATADAEAKRQGKLSSTQKKVLKGAVAAGAIVAVVGTYRMAQSGQLTRLAAKGKAFVGGKEAGWAKNEALSADMTPDAIMASVVSKINPDKNALGAKMNCKRCTYAYEMRRRGYDVAATRTTNARGQSVVGDINASSPGAKDFIGNGPLSIFAHQVKEQSRHERGKITSTPLSNVIESKNFLGKEKVQNDGLGWGHNIFKSLEKQPEGARGELAMAWEAGGGHSVAWEIIGGKPVIFDTQSGKKFASEADLHLGYKGIKDAGISRLDNVPMNHDFLLRWLKDA